jgi:hypothetical protein
MIRTYSELEMLRTFKKRYDYLRLRAHVGDETFGSRRHLNQILYNSYVWKRTRDEVILRDLGCDLGIPGYEIHDRLVVHHMNPITLQDIELRRDCVFDPEGLISTSHDTHLAIHFGRERTLEREPIIRRPGDTTIW